MAARHAARPALDERRHRAPRGTDGLAAFKEVLDQPDRFVPGVLACLIAGAAEFSGLAA